MARKRGERARTRRLYRQPARRESGLVTFLAPLCLLVILLGIWWAITAYFQTPTWVFPTPQGFFERLLTALGQSWMWQRFATTLWEALAGSFLGTVVALPIAWLTFRSRIISAALNPFLGATQAIPAVALAPVLSLWVGYGFVPIVILCAIIVFFPVLVYTTVGLRQIDPDLLGAAALDGASRWRMIFWIEAPLAAPSLLAGVRNGFTLSVTGAVVGEMVMGGTGLAQTLTQQRSNLDTTGMFVTVAFLCLMAMTLYSLVYAVERRHRRLHQSDSTSKRK